MESNKLIAIFLAFFGFIMITSVIGTSMTGYAIMDGISLPTMPVVITTALVDSINPCAIGVLILLIATLVSLSKDKKKMLLVGSIYIIAVYITYLLAGLGLLLFLQRFNLAEPIGIFVGGLVIILGLLEIKEFWWYGQGISLQISPKHIKKIEKMVRHVSAPGAILLGIFVAAVELPCTGGPYLAITTLLARIGFNYTVLSYLLLYNFIFVLPLIIILLLVYFGMKTKDIKKWKQNKRKWMRLFIGIVMLILGILLILFSTGVIRFTLQY